MRFTRLYVKAYGLWFVLTIDFSYFISITAKSEIRYFQSDGC